jgi:xylulose-5-phosphate/fructose-6-phosphate phosphoketolase
MVVTTSPQTKPLSDEELQKIHAYWRACNYLAIGMIYLRDNPLLKEPLKAEQVKHRLLGHWGASPALSFTYIHCNMIFLAGPGHGAPGVLAPVYLEGTYSEIYPNKSEDEEGMRPSSSSSPSPAASAATAPRRPPARSTRAASSATRSATPSAPPSTTRT